MTSIDFVLVCHVLQVFDEELKLGFQVCYSNGQYLLTSACFCNRRKFLLCVCVLRGDIFIDEADTCRP